MKRRILMSRKRLMMSMIMVFAIAIATIVSFAVVFAASFQDVSTKIKVKYIIDGVGVKISASYVTVTDGTASEKTQILTTDGQSELEFGVSDEVDLSGVSLEEVDITLNSSTTKAVYEYKFTNTAQSAFTISLGSSNLSSENMKVRYKVSRQEITAAGLAQDFNDASLMTQAVTEQDASIYIYISVEMLDTTQEAVFTGEFVWSLICADESNVAAVYFDNGEGTGIDSYSFIKGSVAMPLLYDIPQIDDVNLAFEGYYTAANGAGTKYINADGTSAHVADLYDGQTLYAYYTDDIYLMDGTSVVGLTEAGENLTTLTLPSEATAVGDSAFENNTVVTSVVIPNSVTSIGTSAFKNATSLESVTIGETSTLAYADEASSLTSIGASAFNGCTSLLSFDMPDSVTSLGNGAFSNCSAIKSIKLSNSLTAINSYVFFWCKSLEAIDIPSSVTTIGAQAFQNCWKLTNVVIPEGVTTMSSHVFCNNYALKSVTIPSTLTSIKYRTFYQCSALTEINYNATSLADFTSTSALFKDAGLYRAGITVNIGANVTKIPAYMFYIENTANVPKITSVVFAENSQLTTIGDYAFSNCSKLATFDMPDSVTTIGENSFSYCSSLTELVFGENSQITTVKSAAYNYSGLNKLIFNNEPRAISFKGITNMQSGTVQIPEVRAKSLETWIKINFGSWNQTPLYSGLSYLYIGDSTEPLKDLVIPESVTGLGFMNFAYCRTLETLYVHKNVTYLNGHTFLGCTKLKSVTFEEGSTLKTIQQQCFRQCPSLTTITIPASVTTIGGKVFEACDSLTNIEFENAAGWTYRKYAENDDDFSTNFSNWLVAGTVSYAIELSDSVSNATTLNTDGANVNYYLERKPEKSFTYNASDSTIITGLSDIGKAQSHIEVPSTATAIEQMAFSDETNLVKVYIPESVTSIGYGAFSGCSNLTYNTYDNANYLGNEDNPYHALIEATSTTIASCEINENTKLIAGGAFASCSNLASITIPSSVISIETGVFADCTALQSVNISSAITTIPAAIFIGCTSLTDVTLPDNITSIGNAAFAGTSITSIEIKNVETLGYGTFEDCANLTSITISNNLQSMQIDTFRNCGLTEIHFYGTEDEFAAIDIPAGSGDINNDPFTNATVYYYYDAASYFNLSDDGLTLESLTDEGKAASEIIVPSTVTTIAGGGS